MALASQSSPGVLTANVSVSFTESNPRRREWRRAAPQRWWDVGLWSYPAQDAPHFQAVVAWLSSPASRPGLLLHGEPSRGKTGLALGVLRELLAPPQYTGAFCVVPELLEDLRQSYRQRHDDEAPDPLERIRKVPVLVLDDIGAERVTDWVQDRLYLLVNGRHANPKLLTIFTSNLGPGPLSDHLGERIAWRIIEMCQVVKVDGSNLRDRVTA